MAIGVSYFGSRILRHVSADMEALAARGFTGVLHTMSENDFAYYRETMGRIVAASKAAGLEVAVGAWGLGRVFGGEAESNVSAIWPEAAQVLDDGSPTGAACPNSEAFRAFAHSWAEAAVASGADSIFWDEPHWVFPSHFRRDERRWGCRCTTCLTRFATRFGEAMPTKLTKDVLAFREACLVEFLGELVAHVKAAGARSTVCLLPLVDGPHSTADWEAVARLPGLDTLATDPYWQAFGRPVDEFVGYHADRLASLAARHGVKSQLWIQGFRLGPEDREAIVTAVEVARSAGVTDLWTWGYEACGHMSYLGTRSPEQVWETLCSALLGPPTTEADTRSSTHRANEGPITEGLNIKGLITEEQRSDLGDLDLRPTIEIVRLLVEAESRVAPTVAKAVPEIAAAAEEIAGRLSGGGRLIYVGAGSAGRLGVLDAAECGPTFGARGEVLAIIAGGTAAVTSPSEGAEDDDAAGARELSALAPSPRDVVVGVSASGRTPYVLGAVRAGRGSGALTVGVSCQPSSALSAEVDLPIEVPVGPEVIAGSTRLSAGSAQKVVLNALSTAAMVRLGRTFGNLMVDASAKSAKLAERARGIVERATGASATQAETSLAECGGEVKTAIVGLLGNLAPERARGLLEDFGGSVRRALQAHGLLEHNSLTGPE